MPECRAPTPAIEENQPGPSRPRGRPRKPFDETSLKTKKRRVSEILAGRTSDELQFAADLAANTSVRKEASSLPIHQVLALCLDLQFIKVCGKCCAPELLS